MDAANRRVVILGTTGSGKSSLGNTIFGEDVFKVNHTYKFERSECQEETRSVNGKTITLMDTPGFFDTDTPEQVEILRSITDYAPGPHAFLIVLKVEKFTDHERAVVTKIEKSFSEKVFKYAAVVFTHGDQLEEGQRIEDFIRDNESLRDLVRKCSGRCHVIDNKHWKENPPGEYRSNKFQVGQLLQTIDRMIKKNNDDYTNKVLQVEEENKRVMKTNQWSPGHLVQTELLPAPTAAPAASNRKIVLLGTTGSGKSSLGNTIFGEEVFKVNHTSKHVRSEFQKETRSVNGRTITLMDTPCLFDTDTPEEYLKDEISRSITNFAPGPHAFLIVLKVEKFTDHERAVVTKIKKSFSEEAFKYAAVVFTHGDQLEEGQTIKDFVSKEENLRGLVRKCGGRCYVIDNKYWKENPPGEYRSNKFQVGQLLQTIDRIRDNTNYTKNTKNTNYTSNTSNTNYTNAGMQEAGGDTCCGLSCTLF